MWSLDGVKGQVYGLKGFYHAFEVCEDVRVKYLINRPSSQDSAGKQHAGEESGGGLVIFVHGWPDSSFVWRDVLLSLNSSPTNPSSTPTLIALDLPGHGGSQSLEHSGPNEMLEIVFLFICG